MLRVTGVHTVRQLWNRNFSLLWQGQLISELGNVAFSVALGFWVLELTTTPQMPTGNMALMGLIEACFALPAILLGPFAGAFVDRHDRKSTLVIADAVRGILFCTLGATALFRVFSFWIIYPISVLSGACGAFFNPAISSCLPDIVPSHNLSRANSARSLSSTATQLVGSSFGGVLYAWLSAPILVLANGASFLYASVSQLFLKVPKPLQSEQRKPIFHDMIDGIRYVFSQKGIRALMIMNMGIGFFSSMILTLLTPIFRTTPGFGIVRYGYMMAIMTIGAVVVALTLSLVKIQPRWRSMLFFFCQITVGILAVVIGIVFEIKWIFPIVFIIGGCNSVIGVILQTVLQVTTPPNNRGKVFGTLGALSSSLWPLGMAFSGVAASLIGLRETFIVSSCMMLLLSVPIIFSRYFRQFLNTEGA
jgi:MFS transporter, DHA3 family, macrolide efflux protein